MVWTSVVDRGVKLTLRYLSVLAAVEALPDVHLAFPTSRVVQTTESTMPQGKPGD